MLHRKKEAAAVISEYLPSTQADSDSNFADDVDKQEDKIED